MRQKRRYKAIGMDMKIYDVLSYFEGFDRIKVNGHKMFFINRGGGQES